MIKMLIQKNKILFYWGFCATFLCSVVWAVSLKDVPEGSMVAIKNISANKYLQCPGTEIMKEYGDTSNWATFTGADKNSTGVPLELFKLKYDRVGFKASNGKYLQSVPNVTGQPAWVVRAQSATVGEAEQWIVIEKPDGTSYLISEITGGCMNNRWSGGAMRTHGQEQPWSPVGLVDSAKLIIEVATPAPKAAKPVEKAATKKAEKPAPQVSKLQEPEEEEEEEAVPAAKTKVVKKPAKSIRGGAGGNGLQRKAKPAPTKKVTTAKKSKKIIKKVLPKKAGAAKVAKPAAKKAATKAAITKKGAPTKKAAPVKKSASVKKAALVKKAPQKPVKQPEKIEDDADADADAEQGDAGTDTEKNDEE